MSKTDIRTMSRARFTAVLTATTLTMAVVLATGALLLTKYGPGNMGKGFVTGGSIVFIVFVVATFRLRLTGRGTSFEKAFLNSADERETHIFEKALAVLGLTSLPVVAFAMISIALGAPPEIVLTVTMLGLLAIFGISFVVQNRKN